MVIGIPKRIKNDKNRVALTPAGALTLTRDRHRVLIEPRAGEGSDTGRYRLIFMPAGAERSAACGIVPIQRNHRETFQPPVHQGRTLIGW